MKNKKVQILIVKWVGSASEVKLNEFFFQLPKETLADPTKFHQIVFLSFIQKILQNVIEKLTHK